MSAERCPLCQSKLNNGECESCGYKLPDENDIKSLYNYVPSDYPQEQPAVREITPEHQMEEIYPNRPELIDFKVRDNEINAVNDIENNPDYQNNDQYPHQPYNGSYQQNNGNSSLDSELLRMFLERFWILPLLAFVFPFPIGVIIFIVIVVLTKNDQGTISSKIRNLTKVALILGFIFSYFSPFKIFW